MSVTKNLTVPYYQQETNYYCGAACAKMVLEEIGAGALDQDDLYVDNNTHSTIEGGWASAPDGVNWTMQHRKPASWTNGFVTYSDASEDALSRKVAWTIEHYEAAPIALVFGSQHWIAVKGYEASAAPTSAADLSIALSGLFIHNPWPPVGEAGIANEHLSYSTWVTDYMTGATGGHWGGKFVAVCDPEMGGCEIGRREPEPGERRRQLLSPEKAARYALDGIERHGLREQEEFARGLDGAEPFAGRLVQRLDRTDSFYHLVPMARDGRASAVVSVDALDARYLQTAILPADGDWDLASLGREAVYERFVGARLEIEGTRGPRAAPRRGRMRVPGARVEAVSRVAVAELSVRHDHRR